MPRFDGIARHVAGLRGARVAGTPVVPSLVKAADAQAFREPVEKDVRYANINIIEGTGASQLGIRVVVTSSE